MVTLSLIEEAKSPAYFGDFGPVGPDVAVLNVVSASQRP
jgi:hypothetical protein